MASYTVCIELSTDFVISMNIVRNFYVVERSLGLLIAIFTTLFWVEITEIWRPIAGGIVDWKAFHQFRYF